MPPTRHVNVLCAFGFIFFSLFPFLTASIECDFPLSLSFLLPAMIYDLSLKEGFLFERGMLDESCPYRAPITSRMHDAFLLDLLIVLSCAHVLCALGIIPVASTTV